MYPRILVKHVDDLKIAGVRASVKRLMEALERTFGKLEMERCRFVHCGIRHIQNPQTKEVSLDQVDFLAAIKEMPAKPYAFLVRCRRIAILAPPP